MDRLTINLLPTDILVASKEIKKKSKVTRISITVMVIAILITVGVLALRLFQNAALSSVNQGYNNAKSKVSSYKDQEGEVVFLKNRLNAINQLIAQDPKAFQAYNLLNEIFPASTGITSLTLNKGGTIVVSFQVSDDYTLQQLFNNVTDPSVNQGKVGKVQIDSMNRNASGVYRVDMTINTI